MNLGELGKKTSSDSNLGYRDSSGIEISFNSSVPNRSRKITNSSSSKTNKKPRKVSSIIKKVLLVIFLFIFIGGGAFYLIKLRQLNKTGIKFSPLDPIRTAISAIAAPEESAIKKLAQTNGRTNFLMIGVDARSKGGSLLTDSMMLLSYSQEKNEFAQISFPRDLETHYKNSIYKLNSVFPLTYSEMKSKGKTPEESYDAAFDNLAKSIEEISGQPIHYGIMINFNGFKEVIDILGGITVDVERDFTDYQYPCDNDACIMTVSFKKGITKMNGKTALQYARSRHSPNPLEGSDFARARRQQNVINAIKGKFMESDVISKADSINQIITDLGENIRFFNLTGTEINYMVQSRDLLKTVGSFSMVLDFKFGSFTGQLLTDKHRDSYSKTGYILYPTGKTYDDVQALINYYMQNPFLLAESANVRVVWTDSKRFNDYVKAKKIFFDNSLKVDYNDGMIKVTNITTTPKASGTITPTSTNSPTPTEVPKFGRIYAIKEDKPKTLEHYQKMFASSSMELEIDKSALPKEFEKFRNNTDILIVID